MYQSTIIKPRRPVFNLQAAAKNPAYWHSNDPIKSHLFNALSTTFPQGERFFIDSVRNCREQVTDKSLNDAVKGLIGQEANHSMEHEDYNNLLRAAGYNVDKLYQSQAKIIAFIKKRFSKQGQLAVTCAIEHFTAILANALLKHPEYLQGAAEEYQRLWRWHAIEEIEHKSVCFDVYQSISGGYIKRICTMLFSTIEFVILINGHYLRLLKKDGLLWRLKTWRDIYRLCWSKQGLFRRIVKDYLTYYRKGFHPWQENNMDLVTRYLAEIE